MKKIIKLILIIIFFFLSYLIPKKKNLYIFWSIDWKSFSWNSKVLYTFIKKYKKDIDPIYISDYEWFTSPKSFKSFLLILRAKYIFIETDLSQISEYVLAYQAWRLKVINLWHWEPIKKIWFEIIKKSVIKKYYKILLLLYKNFFLNATIIWTTWSEINKINLNIWHLTNKFIVTWLARNEIFFNKELILNNIKDKINIWTKKIILYAPTYRDNWEIYTPIKDINKLNNILEKNNYILLIKAHHWDKKINILESKYIINVSNKNYDIQELLYYTDILISDYSSLYIDFLLTDRPIIFYPFDLSEYLNNRNMYFDYGDVIIKDTTAYNEKELLDIIYNIKNISKFDEYIKKYKEIKNLFHKYQKWWYCENILNEIKKNEKNINNNSFN